MEMRPAAHRKQKEKPLSLVGLKILLLRKPASRPGNEPKKTLQI